MGKTNQIGARERLEQIRLKRKQDEIKNVTLDENSVIDKKNAVKSNINSKIRKVDLPSDFFDDHSQQKLAEESLKTNLNDESFINDEVSEILETKVDDIDLEFAEIEKELEIENKTKVNLFESRKEDDIIDANYDEEVVDKHANRFIGLLKASINPGNEEAVNSDDESVSQLKKTILKALKAKESSSTF